MHDYRLNWCISGVVVEGDEINWSVVTDAESSEDDEVEDNNEEAEKVFVDEVNQDDVCVKLETMIRESKKNRYLWDKLNSLPP